MSTAGVGLPEALELAAEALPGDADSIRPANGDPIQLRQLLDAAAATRVLSWLLVNQPADGADLASEWAEDPDAAELVLGVDESELPKAGRKALRRVRHQLRSRGVEVHEEKRTEVVAKLPALEEGIDEALLSPIDPRGTRVAFLVTSHPSGGARMFEVLLDDTRGIVETRVYNAGRSQVRRFTRSFSQRDEFPAVSADPASVRALVKRIAASHPADRPLPRGFSEWRAQVAQAPEGTPTPGETARQELGEVEAEPSLLRQAQELVREGKVGPWPPEPEALHALAEQLGEAARGQVVLSGAQRRERLDGIVEEALEGLFAEPFAGLTATRFEEMAYWFSKRDNEADARVCLAAARAFRESPARENSVARTMLEVVLAPVMAKLEEEANQAESGGEET